MRWGVECANRKKVSRNIVAARAFDAKHARKPNIAPPVGNGSKEDSCLTLVLRVLLCFCRACSPCGGIEWMPTWHWLLNASWVTLIAASAVRLIHTGRIGEGTRWIFILSCRIRVEKIGQLARRHQYRNFARSGPCTSESVAADHGQSMILTTWRSHAARLQLRQPVAAGRAKSSSLPLLMNC